MPDKNFHVIRCDIIQNGHLVRFKLLVSNITEADAEAVVLRLSGEDRTKDRYYSVAKSADGPPIA